MSKTAGDPTITVGDQRTKDVIKLVDKMVSQYDPNAGQQDENVEFTETATVSLTTLLTRFADCGDYFYLSQGLLWSFVFGGSLPAFCLVFGELMDDMGEMGKEAGQQGEEKPNPMQEQSVYMIYVACGVFVTSALYISCLAIYSESIAHRMKIAYFDAALSKDAAFYDEQNPNEMASKINKEASAVQRGTSEKIGNINMAISGFILGYVAAFYFGWKYSLILLGALPCLACSGILFGASLETGTVQQMKAYAQSAGYAEQALQSVKIVHTYGNEMLEYGNYTKYLDRARAMQRQSSIAVALAYATMFAMFFFFYAGSFYFGGLLRWREIKENGELYTGGKCIAIMFCVIFGAMQMGMSGPAIIAFQQARVAMKLALNVIDQVPIVDPNKRGMTVSREGLRGQIEFKDVCFKYPTRPDVEVLKNFTATFSAGQTTALVGPSGSGKSTIIQMIERFYQNDSGNITVDGNPIESLDLRGFRRMVGYVGQEPVLFNCSIKENMRFAKPEATEDEIREALVAANAWNFVQKMTNKTETIVGGSGGSLSGGQKQRVAIARAFLKQPRILLLDEATSALDKVNEGIVQEAIDKYRKSHPITTIVIAHRLSTIKDADNILVLVNGKLEEQGNNDSLLANYPNGTYASFCAKQAASEEQNQNTDSAQKAMEDVDEIIPDEPEKKEEETASGGLKKRTRTIKDAMGRTKTIAQDVEVTKMLEQADEADEKRSKEIEEIIKPLREQSDFMKVMAYNSPQFLIPIACLLVGAAGFCQPLFGWVFSNFQVILTNPQEFEKILLLQEGYTLDNWKEQWALNLEKNIVEQVIYTLIMAGVMWVGYLGKSYIFSYLGENVTLKIRQLLYFSILQKHIGWFDEQDNQSSVLTSAMATESSIINGVASESLGPNVEAMFALFGGLIIGFIFCWQESLITLGCVPFIIAGNYVGIEFQKGLASATGDIEKQANLLIGDAINNFKTVQSFGYEHKILEKYKSFINPIFAMSKTKHLKAGIAFGFSQFIVYVVFAALFYFGGMIIDANCVDVLQNIPGMGEVVIPECTIDSKDVFIALFAIFFGANQAGTAAAMGPDMGKAQIAATRIFKIIEQPSEINAIEMDKYSNKKVLDPTTVLGKIEFRNVWFRYPTRKDDFVLRGLTMTILPNESVALVGESGCGKSTFVNLMMRFYDPQFGEILLDDVNIKDYNLHTLRKALSLVMQEPSIFNYSIKENILYGNLHAKNSQIVAAANIANCNEFIEKGIDSVDDSVNGLAREMEQKKSILVENQGQQWYDEKMEVMNKLKEQVKNKGAFESIGGDIDKRQDQGVNFNDENLIDGYDIQCGLKGGKLSGGQKQRVAIARTLIANPKVLLLDEATSALDENSQKKVQEAIENAMQNRTTIIIAHRMSTIEKCSKIFVLEEGRVKEEGNFNDLKNSGGAFAKLAQAKQQ